MKIIQFIIIVLTLLYTSLKGYAQTEKDTVRITFKGKNYTLKTSIEPEEEERKRTLKFVDTLTKKMVLITVKTKAMENDLSDSEDQEIDRDSNTAAKMQKKIVKLMNQNKSRPEKERNFIETSFLPNIDLGFTSTMAENDMPSTMTPKLGKSANINIGIIRQNMNIYNDQILFSYGIGLNNYYLKYDDKQKVQYLDNQGLLKSYTDSVNNYDKNRLDVRYISIPVMLEYHTKNDKFSIAAGLEFGFNGRSKLTLKGDRESLDFKQKNHNDIKISPEQLNAVVRIGIHGVKLYGRYSITDMYRPSAYLEGQNPNQHLFSVGVCLIGI